MGNIIDKAKKIVEKAANKYEAANDVYYVEQGVHEDRMTEHGSLENYCENCIDAAVMDKKREYFLERTSEMGKIYEYQKHGFYREPRYKWGKDGKANGLFIKKVKAKEPKEKVVKYLEKQLRKKYPVNMIFSYRYTSCGETDDFDLCEGCGVIFNQGLLLSDQELDHWETNVTDEHLKEYIYDPYHAYQLDKIIYSYHFEDEHADRIKALAQRIVDTARMAKSKN